MKRIIMLSVFCALVMNMIAQTIPTASEMDRFFTTKTLVVLDNNPMHEFNYILKDILAKEWKVTDYEYIDYKEFDEKRMDPQYSFLYMDIVSFDKDKTDAKYNFMFCSLGGDYVRRNQMPDIVSVPLSFANVDEDSYAYKLAVLIRFMHNHIELLKNNPDLAADKMFKHYNENMAEIKDKTLYLIQEELSKEVNSLKRIKDVYPYKVRIVTKEEIEKAIEDKDDNVVFLHKVGPEGTKLNARCYKIIIGASDAKFYYFGFHKVSEKKPDGILAEDFKKMAKAKDK